jgi:hypothetical protein
MQERKKPMKRIWTIIAVADVSRSFAWYQSLLGLPALADFWFHTA